MLVWVGAFVFLNRTTTAKHDRIGTEVGGIMIKRRSWLIYLFGLPSDLVGALLTFLLAPYQRGPGWLHIEKPPNGPGLWVLTLDVRRLPGEYAAIAISPHVIFYRSGRHFKQGWSVLQDQEHRALEQYERAAFVASVLAAVGFAAGAPWIVMLVLWSIGPWVFMLAGVVVAWLRGEDPCDLDSDEAAYAIAAEIRKP